MFPGTTLADGMTSIGKTSSTALLAPRKKKGPFKLLMGPWAHGTFGSSYSRNCGFRPRSRPEPAEAQMDLQLKWFDQTLKGIDTGDSFRAPGTSVPSWAGGDGKKDGSGRLRHGGSWLAESSWPLANTQLHELLSSGEEFLGSQPLPLRQSPSSTGISTIRRTLCRLLAGPLTTSSTLRKVRLIRAAGMSPMGHRIRGSRQRASFARRRCR